MIYVLLMLICVILIIMKSFYDEKNNSKRTMQKLKEEWGAVPTEEYTNEKFHSLQTYYQSHKDLDMDIDDITWNDIDMDKIFMLMNNTGSAIGEEYLYSVLRKLQCSLDVLKERNRLIEFFQSNEESRNKLQRALCKMGKLENISLFEYMNHTENIKKESNLKHYLSIVGLLGSVGCLFVSIPIGIVLIITFLILNITKYYQRKAEIEKYFRVFSYILGLLKSVSSIYSLDIPEISQYTDKLKQANRSFKNFKRGSKLVVSGNAMGGDLMDTFMDYIRILFHVDIIKFNSMLEEFQNNQEQLLVIYEQIGILDSMIAVASFRTLLGNRYCVPELEQSEKPFIEVKEIYHPMIDNPVMNSFSGDCSVLITGSNASGKSTFIKTMAINAILAQTVYTSLSESYKASFFKVYTSMALKDDILSQESYYIVEIKSLKRILDRLDEKIPVLCFVDEVLRGTNTLERIAASSQILKSLSSNNALCFAATHDIELTYILEKHYVNYHFQEQIKDKNILFDYILYAGRAESRNAIKLLGIIGYDDSIIEKATEEANYFMEFGNWNEL